MEVSTPTAGVRVPVIPPHQRRLQPRRGGALHRPHALRAGRGRRSPRRARRSCRWRARRAGCAPVPAGCRRERAGARCRRRARSACRGCARRRRSGSSRGRRPASAGRPARAPPRPRPAAPRSAPAPSSIAEETLPGSPPRARIADPLAGQPVADQHRVDAFGEFVGAPQLAAQLVGPGARVLEVADEAVLEVPAGVVEGVAAELGADQDPDRQGEEDRDQRGGVVARAVTHQRAKARWSAPGVRYSPSQILIFSQTSWTRSLSAGEVMTTIASRIAKAARKRADRGRRASSGCRAGSPPSRRPASRRSAAG